MVIVRFSDVETSGVESRRCLAGSLARRGPMAIGCSRSRHYRISRAKALSSRSRADPITWANMRRFEILLPLQFNDGSPVPAVALHRVIEDLRRRFGAVSLETQTIHGVWESQGMVYRDDLSRLFIDVPDTSENIAWSSAFKEQLKADFQQLDLWVTSYPITVH
jgi:hypothetical protein